MMDNTTNRAGNRIEVEPYWNVNPELHSRTAPPSTIEVEPYWNVNLIIWQRHPIYDGIEVEPYWNVNELIERLTKWDAELK